MHFGITATLNYDEPSLSIYEQTKLASSHTISDSQGYLNAIENLVTNNFQKFLRCTASTLNQECLTQTISHVGRLLFRRNLTPQEIEKYKEIALSQGVAQLTLGTKFAIVALLNSTHFLYQQLYGVNGKLSDLELASKISFFILRANPDEELLNAVSSGKLSTPEGLASEVNRLLADKQKTAELFSDLLIEIWRLNRLEESLSAEFYKEDMAALSSHLKYEFKLVSESIYKTYDGDWRKIFDHNKTFVNKTLASNYGYTEAPTDDSTWIEATLNKNRSGLLSNGLVLAAHSGNKYTSTTHRGLFLINNIQCRTISFPTDLPGLIASSGIVLSDEDTVYQRVQKISKNNSCSGCHSQFDPYGFVFENFDNFGRYFTIREGSQVYSTSVINGKSISSVSDLSFILSQNLESIADCFARKVYTFATGVSVLDKQLNILNSHSLTGPEKYNFDSIVRSIILHSDFRLVKN